MWRRWTNTTARRVREHPALSDLSPVCASSSVLLSFQIIKKVSVELLAFRVTEWINQPTVGSIMRKLINTNHRKVKKRKTE